MKPTALLFQHYHEWFIRYANRYIEQASEQDRPGFALKLTHTLNVVKESLWLAGHSQFSDADQHLSGIIALLHDVGRFPQFEQYHTFNDRLSCNHAAASLAVIRKHALLANLTPAEQQLVRTAVVWHNQKDLPAALPARLFQFAGLVRDADKLDIFRTLLAEYATQDRTRILTVDLDLPDGEDCSPGLLQTIAAGRMGDARDVHSRVDLHLIRLSWVFAFHNPVALRRFNEHAYLEQYRPYLPVTASIEKALQLLQSHVDQALKTA